MASCCREFLGQRATPDVIATWIEPDDVAAVLVELLLEGPSGRTGTQIGLWVGHPVRLPPPPSGTAARP